MSPSNFPATNPEVIRKAIETRAASLSDGIQNLIGDLQKADIHNIRLRFAASGAKRPCTMMSPF
jgi:poly(3-hydroxyalkanoate) synthetase